MEGSRPWRPTKKQEKTNTMKKIITTLTAATFVLGLAAAGYAQTAKTPEMPGVKTEAPAVSSQTVKPGEPAAKEATKGTEQAKPAAKEAAKPAEKSKKEMKKEAKKAKAAKKQESKKTVAPVEKTKPETK
jgi:hypothetical protein